ncbi:MAG: hypothetical protein EOP60_09015 [Sphingomonadales bacterium]|nr:MAG: hypothetical protein EOP60_09015 [Sphingomonadales bacterium]
MTRLIAGLLALTGFAPAVSAADFCAELKQVVAAGFEAPAFKSVALAGPDISKGAVMFGGFERCSITRMSTGAQYGCSIAVPTSEAEAIELADAMKAEVKKCFGNPVSWEPSLAYQYATRQTNFMVTQPLGTAEIAIFPKLTSLAANRTVTLIVFGPPPPSK